MYCKKCGKELKENVVFCPFCGQKQDEENKENVRKENGSISDKKLILVGVIVAILILAVIGIVKLTGKGNEQADVETTVMKENVEEMKIENTIPKNATESKDGKLEDGMEDIAEETETISDLQKNENFILKYMKVGDSEECWYDEDGDLVKVSTDWRTMDIQYVTDAEGNKVCGDQVYFDEQPISIWSVLGTEEFIFYDAKSHLIQSIHYYEEGYTASFEFIYDEKKRLIESMCENNQWGDITEVSFEYLEGGNKMVASYQYISNTEEFGYEENLRKGVFQFSNGKMISFTLEQEGLVEDSGEWEYDTNGNIVRESRNMDFAGRMNEYKNQYDKNGNKIRVEKSGTDGDEITEYQYNENGKEIRIESSGTNGNGITEYQYNESGNLIRTVSVQDEGKEGKVTTERQYDENGKETKYERTIERWKYDEEGNITQRTSSDENIISEYDEEGKLNSYAYLHSSTEGDVVSYDSQYLYDEQGRIVEITVDGQTAVTVNYNEAGIIEKIDSVTEVDPDAVVRWELIYDLLPRDEQIQGMYYKSDYINRDINIEYR